MRGKAESPKRSKLTGAGELSYDVGYKRPPRHSQFQKGRSGNPAGRPKRARNTSTLLQEELDRLVTITELGRQTTISKRDAFIKSLVARAIKGDARAGTQLLKAIEAFEPAPAVPASKRLGPASAMRSGARHSTGFPDQMPDAEYEAKYGPKAFLEREPEDAARMTDDQLLEQLRKMHATVSRQLEEADRDRSSSPEKPARSGRQ